MPHYDPKEIEAKWNKKWLDEKVFAAHDDSKKPKYYQLETFPYPSAAGLHMGHPKGYTAEDIHARYMRMHGYEVLYTIGWDAFGLPTENYAIKVGRNPHEVAHENTDNFRRQVQMFGFSYDWDREVDTSSPEYYKWTQWIFIQLYKKGLAYRKDAKVNWCPKDQTVLANEQVIDGKCERCGTEIEERAMEQWFLKITDYADRLISDLQGLDWPAASIKRQEDWIGKSEGALLKFQIANAKFEISSKDQNLNSGAELFVEVFTTRPDTLFGATYLVLAPEHALIAILKANVENWDEVAKYIEETTHKTDRMRQETAKEKTGVELRGVHAINPATKEEIPIYVADYVLGSYGTGAIMAVPAHDERDFEFAKKFGLAIKKVIGAKDELSTDYGVLISSGEFTGLDSQTAKAKIVKFVGGTMKTQYKIRDWSVSRQRYWGVPIPMVHCASCKEHDPKSGGIVPVPESELPVLLPDLENYRPEGMPPLASSPSFINVKCPQCGGDAKRDAETLDTFVDSSWYFLRYPDPHNATAIFDKEKVAHWMPVDLYVIGAEHTVMHLLYSRFITKFLHDEGLLQFTEPFTKMRHIGLIMGADGQKMSKSKGNVVNPDEIVAEFSADAMRTYLMFLGPFYEATPWDAKGILGVERFLKRFWNYCNSAREKAAPNNGAVAGGASDVIATRGEVSPARQALHRAIKRTGEDIEAFKFNTAISGLMIALNELEAAASSASPTSASVPEFLAPNDLASLIKLLHPFAPHMGQELWSLMGNDTYLDFEKWPEYDPKLIVQSTLTIAVQVNGKTKDTLTVAAGITEDEAKKMALERAKVQMALGGAAPKRVIWVENKLINIVA
jgi:leucyl-tRNA synthetase